MHSTQLVSNRYTYIPTAAELAKSRARLARCKTWCAVRLANVNRPHLLAMLATAGVAAHEGMTSRELVDAWVSHEMETRSETEIASNVTCAVCGGSARETPSYVVCACGLVAERACPFCGADREALAAQMRDPIGALLLHR